MIDDILKDAQEQFKICCDAEEDNRANWVDDVRFSRLGEQWPEDVVNKRKREGRPCLTINRLPSFIRQVTNDARQNKPSIKIHAAGDGATEETAEIINGLIRNIEYQSNADVAYDQSLEAAVTGGFGYFRISTDYANDDSFDQDIVIEAIPNPLNVYGDPKSTCADSSDWNVAFITEMMKESEFKKKYPKADISDFYNESVSVDELWFEENKIRIAEYWTRDIIDKELLRLSDGSVMYADGYMKLREILDIQGITIIGTRPTKGYKVTQRIITGLEVLETNKWAGRYIPIVPCYGDEVIVEGERHFLSLTRFAKDPQRMFNYWRTCSTELVALQPKAPFIGPVGAFNTDAVKWATANTESHAYIEYDGQIPPTRQGFSGPPAGALQEALNASDDMKSIMGIYDASLGARSNETSGRAILARQREGDISTFNFVDNLSRAIRHAGRIIVDLIPAVYSVPRIIRVIHEDGRNESVPINQPFKAQPPTSNVPDASEMQEFIQGITKIYDVTVGKYDVTVTTGPSYTTKREEAAQQMLNFTQAVPAAGPLIGDLLAKNLDWPGADEIEKRLRAMLPPQVQGQNPQVIAMQQQMQQMDMQAKQAVAQLQQQIAQLSQQANDKQQDRALEARKLDIDAFGKETDRIKATSAAMSPEQVQAIVLQTLQQTMNSPDVLVQQGTPNP